MYGIDIETCRWSGRFPAVVVTVADCGASCDEGDIMSAVPKGSVLGTIFFLIYINDMASYTKHYTVKPFANDTIIYLILTAENNCKKLQEDLQTLERWEADWLIEFYVLTNVWSSM